MRPESCRLHVMGMDVSLQSTMMVWMQKNNQQKQKMSNILDVLIFSATPRHNDSLCLAKYWSGYTVPAFFFPTPLESETAKEA